MVSIGSEQQVPLLLQTKLYRPAVATHLIDRPRLRDRLAEAVNCQLTLISAPAGFGKSTLLCQWLNNAPAPAAWLSLDDGDNDLLFFLKYTIAAIHTIFPHSCATTQSLLHATQTPSTDYLSASFINDLANIPKTFMLVLDDYHLIQTPAIHQLLTKLLDHMPPALHLVLTSRLDPPFPLSRLRSRGQLIEIRSADLRFSVAEATDFLMMAVDTRLPATAAATLEARTEGWIAGLRLAAISLQNHPDPEAFLTSFIQSLHHPVMEYLLDEVFSQQPAELQDFLIKTSILDRFSSSLSQAVIASDDPAHLHWNESSWLAQANPFVTRLDEAGEWYRYHHLFQELLQHRLRVQFSSAEIDELHRRAGYWFAAQGHVDEGLRHFLAANDPAAAAQLVEQHYQAFINQEDWPVVRHWLAQLPPAIIDQRPALLLARCWHLHQEFKLAAMPPLLDRAEALLDRDGLDLTRVEHGRLMGEINTLRAQLFYFQGEIDAVRACARQALTQLPPTALFARSLALLYLGAATQALGENNKAVQLLQTAIDSQVRPNTITMRMFLMIAFVYRLSANFKQYHEACQLFLQIAEEVKLPVGIAWANYHLGQLFYEWNDLDLAERHLLAVTQHRYHAHRLPFGDSLMGLALIYLDRNDTHQLDQVLLELKAFSQQANNPFFWRTYRSFVARVRLQQGDIEAAIRELPGIDMKPRFGSLQFAEHTALTQIRILLGSGRQADLQEAMSLLDQWQPLAETHHNTLRLIEILALRALLYQAAGQTAAAVAHLTKSLRLAQPGQLVRTFVDLGQPLANLLRQVASANIESDYMQRLLAACSDLSQEAPPVSQSRLASDSQSPLIDPLTIRETEILEMLQQRMSNKEIATTLFIAPSTVKRHTSNIYQKLGVNNRRQAVARALVLGILSAPGH